MFTSSSFTFHVTGNSNKYCHRSNHYKKISLLECETAIIVKITINPDNQNTMEVIKGQYNQICVQKKYHLFYQHLWPINKYINHLVQSNKSFCI